MDRSYRPQSRELGNAHVMDLNYGKQKFRIRPYITWVCSLLVNVSFFIAGDLSVGMDKGSFKISQICEGPRSLDQARADPITSDKRDFVLSDFLMRTDISQY